jgi:hypothetical protein
MNKKLNRLIFENAIISMEKYGKESMMSPRVFNKRNDIKKSLLMYYESTEEFEKCRFIKEFFEDLDKLADELKFVDFIGTTGEFERIS